MIYRVLKATVVNWVDDDAPSMGAALAFYTLFSVAPILLIVISCLSGVFALGILKKSQPADLLR